MPTGEPVDRRSAVRRPGRRSLLVGASVLALIAAVLAPAIAGASAPKAGGGKGQKIDFTADPPEGFEARDLNAPAPEPGTVHQITMHATETVLEIAPGVKQEMWTFDKTVPGPILRGKVGDTFEITIVNDGKIGHSIDFHASKVAWNVEMRTIEPGEELLDDDGNEPEVKLDMRCVLCGEPIARPLEQHDDGEELYCARCQES